MRNKFVQRIQSIVPVTISMTKMDEYFTRAIKSKFIVLVVTKDGITFEGNEKESVHPDIVEKRLQPEDKVFGFIVNDILKEKDKRRISYVSISYGSFHISAFQIPKCEGNIQYEYWYNPFAVTYKTSLLVKSLKKFLPMRYSIANGMFSAAYDMENSLRIPFYRDQIIKLLRDRQKTDPKDLFKDTDEKTKFIQELESRFLTIKDKALELLGEDSFEAIDEKEKGKEIDIYEILAQKTGCKGNNILNKIEEMVNNPKLTK